MTIKTRNDTTGLDQLESTTQPARDAVHFRRILAARKAIAAATEPTTFAVGTEINLVQRLAAQFPQHEIFCLDPVVCPCSTMYRIHPGYLAWVLEELVAGRVVNRITVPGDVADPARVALERMLAARP